MPDYHVSAGVFGEIYAGTLMPKKGRKAPDVAQQVGCYR